MADQDKEQIVNSIKEQIAKAAEEREPVVIEKETFITVPIFATRPDHPLDLLLKPYLTPDTESLKGVNVDYSDIGVPLGEAAFTLPEVGDRFGPRGQFSPEDTAIFAKPINEGYFKGLKGVVDSILEDQQEDTSAPVGDEEFLHRREQLLGNDKLPDDLAEKLRNMDFNQMPSPISPEFAADLENIRSVQSQAILANLEAAGDNGIGPRGTASFMDKPFSAPVLKFPRSTPFEQELKFIADNGDPNRPSHLPLPSEEQLAFARDTKLLYNAPNGIEPQGPLALTPTTVRGEKRIVDEQSVFSGFAPVFDAAVARRHLFKDLLKRVNAEVDAGPLKGILFFHSVLRVPKAQIKDGIEIDFSMKGTDFRHYNRLKAYTGYLLQLRQKYVDEILGAEAKVMERTDEI